MAILLCSLSLKIVIVTCFWFNLSSFPQTRTRLLYICNLQRPKLQQEKTECHRKWGYVKFTCLECSIWAYKDIMEGSFYLHLSYLNQCRESTETALWAFNVVDVISNWHSGSDKMFNEVLLPLKENRNKPIFFCSAESSTWWFFIFHSLDSRQIKIWEGNYGSKTTSWGPAIWKKKKYQTTLSLKIESHQAQ